jgi:pyrroline-5-carboxylate reductase
MTSVQLESQHIAFLGPGVMAEAMVRGLTGRAGVPPANLLLCGPRDERLQELKEKYRVQVSSDPRQAAARADVLVLSVKPQTLPGAVLPLAGALRPEALVLSIIAGARLRDLVRAVQHQAMIRAMPNTPGQVGAGITVWTATPETSADLRELGRQVLLALGKEVFVEEEDYLNMATAISGTGPAYVYLFMEAMVDAGVHLGFPRRIAEQLVVETVKGAVAFYEHSPVHLARLRNQVTSPGGTSAAALYYLDKAGFRTALSRAIWAAYERSVQLGAGHKRGKPSDD